MTYAIRTIGRTAVLALLALVLASLIMAMAAPKADAQASRIRAGDCDVDQVVVLDPIARTSHLHEFVLNPNVTSNKETGRTLKADGPGATTCSSPNSGWLTSSAWYPTARFFDANVITVYYRDPGNFRVKPIPTDLRMLSKAIDFDGTNTDINFGNCLKVDSVGRPKLDSADHMSHIENKDNLACDSSHPYRIPRISVSVRWPQQLTPSTPVSIGSSQWGAAGTNFHGDYLAAVQDEFNFRTAKGKALIDLCLNDVPLSVQVADPRCGPEP